MTGLYAVLAGALVFLVTWFFKKSSNENKIKDLEKQKIIAKSYKTYEKFFKKRVVDGKRDSHKRRVRDSTSGKSV